ncbi:MAG: carbohydrate binding domain-containing protein, partial [Victivallales bacterium]|nr:carbohydrate binding domain-containing protein [Victivallales bacterium]
TSGGNSGIISGKIPVVPGKTYRLSFWAKASVPAGLTAEFSLWDPAGNHKPQHFHSGAQVKIDSGWKKYEVSIPIPSDVGTYPDLAERMGSITFGTWNGPEVQFLIDDISFQIQ